MPLTDVPFLPYSPAPAGVDMGSVVVTPTGGLALFVRSTGPQNYDPPALTGRILPTINTALSYCRANALDTIYVLPGHVETINAAAFFSNLVAGVRSVGVGDGTVRPTLNWTVAAATWTINQANVLVDNMRLIMDATASTTVTAPLTVSAAGVTIQRCFIEVATGASQLCTTAITVASGANDFSMIGNKVWGATAGTPPDVVSVTAAVARPRIIGNDMQAALSATTEGLVTLKAAATDCEIKNNYLVNKVASSTVALLGFAACTGVVADNYLGITNGTGGATAISTPGNWNMFQNFGGVIAKQGIAITPTSG